jgi:GNAT superfamily N-acetyltransferase
MLPDDVLLIADSWWARDFACAPSDLRPSSSRVQAHAGALSGNEGIWILVVGPCPLISMPAAIQAKMGERALGWTKSIVEDPAQLAEKLAPVSASKIIGPAYIGYATRDSLEGTGAHSARPLEARDAAAVARLRGGCTAEEWEHGGSDLLEVPTFGSFDNAGELAAIAGYELWHGTIAHISIVTAPDRRGRGHGAAAVALAAEHALGRGLLPQYRTLKANQWSIQLAKKLGFEEYGFSTYVRLG